MALELFKLIAVVVSGTLWSAWLALCLREKGVNPAREVLDRFGRLGWMKKVGVLFLVVQMTMFGGAKHGGTNDVTNVDGTNVVTEVSGTNEVGEVENGEAESGEAESSPLQGNELRGPFLSGRPSQSLTSGQESASPLSVTDILPELSITDVARGYRLESVATNDDISYVMPSEGVVRGTWHQTGAYEDVQKVSLGDFLFPLGTNLCSSLWTYTWGKVRPQLKNTVNEIAAVGAPMSAIPDTSRFWTMLTPNDTYLMTWENFAAGRMSGEAESFPLQNGIVSPLTSGEDTASPLLSAQIELFRNGDFITRSNNVESVYRRVNPDDWDDDGIPNEDDDDPLCRAEGEACFGPHQDLSVIINSNAYCWVDVIVPQVNARVTFVGDGHCRLPDPSFIAKAGATNRAVILIGKEYHVRCDMPFEIVAKSDPEVDVGTVSPLEQVICWPVEIEAWEGNGNSFRMHVVPNRVGGGFTWTNVCCSISVGGYAFTYGCDKDCLCTGCAASGYLEYEEFRKGCNGGSCGCSSSGEWVEDGDPDELPESARVSIGFSTDVVLFEDAYTNSYGCPVCGQSTVTRLTCVAYGGEHGGNLTVTLSGIDRLTRVAGAELPTGSVSVEPYQTRTYKVDYHGKEPSEGKDDITASALLVENDTSENLSDEDALTAVKVWTYAAAQSIPWEQRKEIGVGEAVKIVLTPNDNDLSLSVDKTQVGDDGDLYYHAPSRARSEAVTVTAADCSLSLLFQTFEPTALHAVCFGGSSNLVAGVAGNMGMHFIVYVLPTNVSLSACYVMEEGRVATDPIGIFRLPEYANLLDHSLHGAGSWIELNSGNWYHDDAYLGALMSWGEGGSFTWPIPVLWKLGVNGEPYYLQLSPKYDQRFEVDPDGTSRIRKFGYTIQQTTNLLYTVTEGIQ